MLAFDGNTAPYLMYAHARICSILGKVVDDEQEHAPSHIRLDVPAERALAVELIQFPHTLERTRRDAAAVRAVPIPVQACHCVRQLLRDLPGAQG
jgi:arginyl-tRNA synthetase